MKNFPRCDRIRELREAQHAQGQQRTKAAARPKVKVITELRATIAPKAKKRASKRKGS